MAELRNEGGLRVITTNSKHWMDYFKSMGQMKSVYNYYPIIKFLQIGYRDLRVSRTNKIESVVALNKELKRPIRVYFESFGIC